MMYGVLLTVSLCAAARAAYPIASKRPPITNGMQNQVLFLNSLHVCMPVSTKNTMAAMTPPGIDGVYGQSTYTGLSPFSSDMAGKCDGVKVSLFGLSASKWFDVVDRSSGLEYVYRVMRMCIGNSRFAMEVL